MSNNKIEAIHFNNDQAIVQNDHFNNHSKNGHIHINHMNNPKDESHDESNSSPQLYGMEPNMVVDQKYKILLPVRPSKSTSISMKYDGATNKSTSLHGLFLLCLYETVIAILCLHLSLTVYIHKDILYYLYKGISTVVYLLLSLLISLRNGSLRSSLLTFLPYLHVYIRNGVLQSSLLVFLRSNFVRAFPITSIGKYSYTVYTKISVLSRLCK